MAPIQKFMATAEEEILETLKVHRPDQGALGLAMWMVKHLSAKTTKLFEAAEEQYGEQECDTWLREVLIKSGLYVGDGNKVSLKVN